MGQIDPDIRASQSAAPVPAGVPRWLPIAYFLLAGAVGLGMMALLLAQAADVSAASVQELLALDSPDSSTATIGAAALSSGSQLLSYAMVAIATGSACTLLLGAGLGLSAPQHRRTAHRLATIGLWMALAVSLSAMLPITGNPFASAPDERNVIIAAVQWHATPRAVAIGSVAGLLLSSITAVPDRAGAAVHD